MLGRLKQNIKLGLLRAGLVPLRSEQYCELRRQLAVSEAIVHLCDYAWQNKLTDMESRFVDFAMKTRATSNSQFAQDLFVAFVFGDDRDGTFIEFGGADGITHSNSLSLEKRGWRGALIEPNPFEYPLLKRNRPNTLSYNAAIKCSDSDYAELIVVGQLSSIRGYEDRDFHADTRRNSTVRSTVRCIELDEVVRRLAPARGEIDYISMDTEGTEVPILQRFGFSNGPLTFTIETNSRADDEAAIRAILHKKGYKEPFSHNISRTDLWFVREDQYERLV